MSKELEALETIFANEFYDVTEEYNLIKQALTPPTSEEVCKALSDYYGKEIFFKEHVFWHKTIIYGNKEWLRSVSLKDLAKDNRFDLITMIGKFYKSLEEED